MAVLSSVNFPARVRWRLFPRQNRLVFLTLIAVQLVLGAISFHSNPVIHIPYEPEKVPKPIPHPGWTKYEADTEHIMG